MRRIFLSIIVLLAALGLEAQNGVNYVYTQGFEDGTLPEGWSSESVRGQSAWTVENGSAGNPEGAHGGTYRAALRNQGNLSTGDITRLVTPQIDLTGVWQPILVFSHAQAMRSGDNDTLRIYYRTSPTANWVLLQEYADRINRWRNDTVALDAPTSTYQIAFEGTDNMGYGIVIDDVIVRPGITCEVPHDIKCNAGSDEATLQWQASFDTETFRVVISTEQFASVDAVNPASVVVDATTDLFQYSTGKVLANNTTYYAYIAASCKPDDFAMFTFRTRNLVNVPYRATFNLPYESGMINRLASWTYGTNITKSTTDPTLVYTPFINTNTATTNLKQVSVDGTTALIFSGTTQGSLTSTIAKGKYSYAATPELNVDRVNTLQVSFWGSAYSYVGTTYMSSIIVGVMTDPGDKNTFVPVETCTVTTKNHHEHFTVSLAGYTGSGKYVAFMSDFADKINLFYLDNVVIEPIQAVKQAEMPRISNARSKGLTVNVAPSIGTWNVRIAKSFAADFSTVSAADVVYSQDGVTTKSLDVTLSGMEGKELFVYVQSVSGTQTSAWSLPVQIRLPEHVGTMPVTYGFESEYDSTYLISERLRYYSYTSTYSLPSYVLYKPDTVGTSYWPYITTSTSTNAGANGSKGYLIFNKLGQCVVFPEVDAVNKIILDFYIEEYSSSTTYKEAAAVEVGVMTDPYDTTTFHSMGVYKAEAYNQYNHYVVPLLDYTGDGHFIALRAAKNNKTTYYSKVDNVTFTEAGDCVLPTYLQSEVAGDKVNMTWAANGMNKWKVRISTDAGLKAPLAVDESVSTNSYTFTGFEYSTTYYYAVFTDCDGALTSSDTLSFKTGCDPDGMGVPYTMDFESYTGGISTKVMPDCWTTEFYTSGTSNYPYIVSGTTYAHAGSRALYFGNSTAKRITYIALPALSTDINKLQLSLWIRGSATSTNGTLDVGVMTDPEKMTTFTAVGEISVSGNVYAEKTVDLSGYIGSGHYIAIRKKTADALIYYIDDISVVERKDCGKVAVLTAKEPTRNGATIEWKDVQHESKWEVVVMTESLKDSEIDDAAQADKILYRAQVTDTALVLSDDRLQPNSVYYVRVRAMCSEESIGDWSEAVSFQTQCVDMDPRTVGMIDFSNNAQTHFFDCWTVGIREDNATGTYATALPNIAGSATGAFGFYLYIQNKAYTSATNCGSTGAYAILPRINDSEDIRKWQMSFDACTNSTAATNLNRLQVGVITQLNDFSTFVPVKTLDLTYATDSTESTRYTVSFDKYMGDYNDDLGHYIMFYSDVDQKSNYIIVDNIKFDTIRACATPEPDMIRPVVDSVYITWPNTGAGKYLIDLYDEDGELLRTGMTADTAYAFGQLDISTTYEITVRGVCGQDTSYHSMRETFMTTCPVAYGLPYEEDFERYKAGTSAIYYHPACWETYFNGFSGAQARYPNIVTTGYNGSTRAINMQVLHTSTASTPSYAALPAINADLSKAMITLYARADNNLDPYSDYKIRQVAIGISTDVSSLLRLQSTFTPIDTITVSSTEYVRYNHDFSQYAGDGKYIVFQAIDGRAGYSGTGDNAVMIDNIRD
ncbi:MAG: choice-of-anchor J domain-containing protein, partial [Paludibacteraceae bacterium]|nr:choice-of-anchor J domain-containing protein [Paludibacteraceae bacterium]